MNRYEEMSRGALIREVEALAAKVANLRDALEPFASWRDHIEAIGSRPLRDGEDPPIYGAPNMGALRRARTAYKATK